MKEEDEFVVKHREALREALVQKEELSLLLATKGWSILCEILNDQIVARTNKVMLLPLGDPNGNLSVEQQEFMKGEVAGIRTMLQLPQDLLATADAIVEQNKLELEEDGRRDNEADLDRRANDWDPGSDSSK